MCEVTVTCSERPSCTSEIAVRQIRCANKYCENVERIPGGACKTCLDYAREGGFIQAQETVGEWHRPPGY
jgi:hypothetical protein